MNAIHEQGWPRPLKLTVSNFMALQEAGAFQGLSKVELIEGEMLTMSPQHRPHAYAKTQLCIRLFLALRDLGAALEPVVEGTIALSNDSAPEPDIVLTTAPRGRGLIPVSSVELAIEVSDSSFPFDVRGKADLYAKHRIPEYWVFSIVTETIEQMWEPSGASYQQRRRIPVGQPLASLTIPGLTIETDGLI